MEMPPLSCYNVFNPKEGLIPRSLLRNKLMTNEVSLGLIPRSLLRGVSSEAGKWLRDDGRSVERDGDAKEEASDRD